MRGHLSGARTAWESTAVLGSRVTRVAAVTAWSARKVEDLSIDRYYRFRGLDTRGPSFGPALPSGLFGYQASNWRTLRQMFPRHSVSADDVVLEYGSGKGRVVIWLAARFGVQRAVGIERDPELVRAARDNVQAWRGQDLSTRVSFVCADARDCDVPDDVTLVYLFNPFIGEVFDAVLAKIRQSLERNPRVLRVGYQYPIMHNRLISAGFQVESTHRHVFHAWAIYRSPSAA